MCQARQARRSRPLAARVIAEIAVASIGVALLACALAANQRWLDRHSLPSWFLPRHWHVLMEAFVRLAMAAVGGSLAFFTRPRVGRWAARSRARSWPSMAFPRYSAGSVRYQVQGAFVFSSPGLKRPLQRRPRKNSRMSWTRSSGSSIAAKWPPRGIVVYRMTLYCASIQRRGAVPNGSFGNCAQANGTSIRP